MKLLTPDHVLRAIGECRTDDDIHQLLCEAPPFDAYDILYGPPIKLDPWAPQGRVFTLRRPQGTNIDWSWPWPGIGAVQLIHPVTFATIIARVAFSKHNMVRVSAPDHVITAPIIYC